MRKVTHSKQNINARMLRIILSVLVVAIAIATIAGFGYGIRMLNEFAIEVSHTKVDAKASNENIQAYQKMEEELSSYMDVRKKAANLRATEDFPEFRIVDEVREIARSNDLSIKSYSFGGSGSESAAESTEGAAAPSTGSTTPSTTAPGASGAPATSSAKTFSLSTTLASPVNYKDFLQFLYDTERNIPKLQVKGISISAGGSSTSEGGTEGGTTPAPSAPRNPNAITVDALTIDMYLN